MTGVPPGQLELKVGGRYIVIRNIDQHQGIVNGAHLLCTHVTQRHFTGTQRTLDAAPTATPHETAGTLLYGEHAGNRVQLPRISCIITSAQSHLPFTVFRRQFPLIPGYAFTVHRSQGSTLDILGLYFNGSPFCHGLLFTAMSRVRGDWSKITVCSADPDGLRNCVVQHVLQLLHN
jgi:hypothetical protein